MCASRTTRNNAISTSAAGIAAARQLDEISSVGVMTMSSILTCSTDGRHHDEHERERHREREWLGERAYPHAGAC